MIGEASGTLLLKHLRNEVETENSQGTGVFKFFNFLKKKKTDEEKEKLVRDKFVDHAKNNFVEINLNGLTETGPTETGPTETGPTEYYSVSDKDVLFLGSFIEKKDIVYYDRPDGLNGPILTLNGQEYHFKNYVIKPYMESVQPIIYGHPPATEGGRKIKKTRKSKKTKKSRKTRRKSTRRR